MIRRSEEHVEEAKSRISDRRAPSLTTASTNRMGAGRAETSRDGSMKLSSGYRPSQTLEERAAQYQRHARQAGIAYAEGSRVLKADSVYQQAVRALTQEEPQALRDYRIALSDTLEGLDLPQVSQYTPGSEQAERAAKGAIAKVISVLGTTTDEPTDLQRLLVSQGARYFPVMDQVELWARRQEGQGSQREEYWEHVFTHSADREQEVEKLGIKDGQPIIKRGVATMSYGRARVHETQGSIFYSTSGDSLLEQDPTRAYFSEDSPLVQGALHAMRSGLSEEFFEKHWEEISSIIPEFRGKSKEEIKARREELRQKQPNLADLLNQVEIPLWDGGEMVGYLKATYRLRNSEERTEGSDEILRTMVLDEAQRRAGNKDIDEWLVDDYVIAMKLPEARKIGDAVDESGVARFPVPTAEELEGSPQAWNRLHVLNPHQRYVASQRLRSWVVDRKEDEGLEKLLGEEKRQAVRAAIQTKHAQDPTNQYVPERLASIEAVANAGLNVVYGRMLLPVMREHFEQDLQQVETLYGPQRDVTPHDMKAVAKELEVTKPEPAAKVAILEAVQALGPYLVEALGHTTKGTHIDRGQSGLEDSVQRMDLFGQTRAGYEYGEVLGMGAMGVVFEARHKKLGRKVALKLLSGESIHPGVEPEEAQLHKEKFEREGQMLGRLEHPNILRIYDAGQEGDLHYQAVELLGGGDLQQQIDQQGRLEEERVRRVLEQVGSALQETEAQGIIHRDIKPENIMVTRTGDHKLADFGLAIEKEEDAEASGTPLFIAPEQWKGRPTQQSDLYALGTTAYVALTGQAPYGTESLNDLMMAKIMGRGEMAPVREHNPEVSKDLEAIVHKLMAINPDERYKNASELLADLGGQGGPSGTILEHPRRTSREDAA